MTILHKSINEMLALFCMGTILYHNGCRMTKIMLDDFVVKLIRDMGF